MRTTVNQCFYCPRFCRSKQFSALTIQPFFRRYFLLIFRRSKLISFNLRRLLTQHLSYANINCQDCQKRTHINNIRYWYINEVSISNDQVVPHGYLSNEYPTDRISISIKHNRISIERKSCIEPISKS